MNENKYLRFWKWAVALLALCNICLMSVIWIKPQLSFGHRPETPRDFVIRNLKFTEDQVKQYDALISIHKNSMNGLRKESMDYRTQFFNKLKDSAGLPTGQVGKDSSIDSLAQLIANNQKQIELTTFNHFAQVRAICTDAQKAAFDKIIGDVTKMMSRPPATRPGDHDGPPPPDGPPNSRPGHLKMISY